MIYIQMDLKRGKKRGWDDAFNAFHIVEVKAVVFKASALLLLLLLLLSSVATVFGVGVTEGKTMLEKMTVKPKQSCGTAG